MKSAIFTNVLLFLFMQSIVPAYNTVCNYCLGPNSKDCKSEDERCPKDSGCITISEELKGPDKCYTSISRRCAMNMPCDDFLYGGGGTGSYIRMNMKCCKGDRCNTGSYEMPKNLTKEKGIACPLCHEYTLDGCNATKSVVCWREDDQCLKFRGTVLPPDGQEFNVSVQGCASAKACQYDFSEAAVTRVTNLVENTCYIPTTPQD